MKNSYICAIIIFPTSYLILKKRDPNPNSPPPERLCEAIGGTATVLAAALVESLLGDIPLLEDSPAADVLISKLFIPPHPAPLLPIPLPPAPPPPAEEVDSIMVFPFRWFNISGFVMHDDALAVVGDVCGDVLGDLADRLDPPAVVGGR